jgi:hypothetical protein
MRSTIRQLHFLVHSKGRPNGSRPDITDDFFATRSADAQLIDIKRWADRGLYEAVGRNFDRLSKEDVFLTRDARDLALRELVRVLKRQAVELSSSISCTRPDMPTCCKEQA